MPSEHSAISLESAKDDWFRSVHDVSAIRYYHYAAATENCRYLEASDCWACGPAQDICSASGSPCVYIRRRCLVLPRTYFGCRWQS